MTMQAEMNHATFNEERIEAHTLDTPEIVGSAKALIDRRILDLAEIAIVNIDAYEQQRKNLSILAWQMVSRGELDVSVNENLEQRFVTLNHLLDDKIEAKRVERSIQNPADAKLIVDQQGSVELLAQLRKTQRIEMNAVKAELNLAQENALQARAYVIKNLSLTPDQLAQYDEQAGLTEIVKTAPERETVDTAEIFQGMVNRLSGKPVDLGNEEPPHTAEVQEARVQLHAA